MGEAKRRKEAGLAPKTTKKETTSDNLNILARYPRLGIYLGIAFVIYLIYDVISYYNQ